MKAVSLFCLMVFKIAGYKLKRDTSEQVRQGQIIKDFNNAIPGDLAFFSDEEFLVLEAYNAWNNNELCQNFHRILRTE